MNHRLALVRSHIMPIVLAIFCVVAGTFAHPQLAHAGEPLTAEQAKARDEAAELFKQGRNAFKAGDYDAARELFQRAWGVYDKEPLIALALAKAYDKAAALEKAKLYYEHFLRLAPVNQEYLPDREQAVARLAVIKEQLLTRKAVLKFKNLPPFAKLEVDGKPADVDTAGELKVDAGNHAVRITMDKRIPFERPVVSVGPGDVKEIEVVLVAPVDPSTLPRDHKWTWVAGATATAALVTTGVLGFVYWQKYDDYTKAFNESGQPRQSTLENKAFYYNGAPCHIGQKDKVTGQWECQALLTYGQQLEDTRASYGVATAVAGGVTVLAGIGTVIAYVAAPTLEPDKLAPKQTTWTVLPGAGPSVAGASLHLAF